MTMIRGVVGAALSFLLPTSWTCLLVLLVVPQQSSSFCNASFLLHDRQYHYHHQNDLGTPRHLIRSSLALNSITTKATRNSNTVLGPPRETKPDYENIHGPLGKRVDHVFRRVFRDQLAKHLGFDSPLDKEDYQGIMELAIAMNARMSDRQQVQQTAQAVLRAMFPTWMPGSYAVLFSKPFPKFSARMNAWATKMAGTWLMGECELNDVPVVDDGTVGYQQGLLVKRCRFLEESGCASVCVNSCKIPTQNFFLQDMGLPLTMEPNYEMFECQFSFGLTPTAAHELQAKSTPCLMRCPTNGGMRQWHNGGGGTTTSSGSDNSNQVLIDAIETAQQCQLMDSKSLSSSDGNVPQ